VPPDVARAIGVSFARGRHIGVQHDDRPVHVVVSARARF